MYEVLKNSLILLIDSDSAELSDIIYISVILFEAAI